jgi:thiol-disulfide isomerase/thioredoxin
MYYVTLNQPPSNDELLIYFYVPWILDCKNFDPTWEQLVQKYGDTEHFTIAKFDLSQNFYEFPVYDMPMIIHFNLKQKIHK